MRRDDVQGQDRLAEGIGNLEFAEQIPRKLLPEGPLRGGFSLSKRGCWESFPETLRRLSLAKALPLETALPGAARRKAGAAIKEDGSSSCVAFRFTS